MYIYADINKRTTHVQGRVTRCELISVQCTLSTFAIVPPMAVTMAQSYVCLEACEPKSPNLGNWGQYVNFLLGVYG